MHNSKVKIDTSTAKLCYHCGDNCRSTALNFNGKLFCCEGCKLVFELLSESELCSYYTFNNAPGISPGASLFKGKFDYLDNELVRQKLIHFTDGNQVHINFYIPKMHCSSCIWLLENLQKIKPGIINSRVDFLKKETTIVYNQSELKLSEIAEVLAQIGYEPLINLNDLEAKPEKASNRSLILKIGLAGFCFGNIMMLSFPEYFSLGNFYEQGKLKIFFGYLNIMLAIPVLIYSASDFFISAYKSISKRYLNIDFPIALAILMTFSRSVYEILSGTGAGYMDSMTGIVFFMLLGRYFQDLTYQRLSFERDYKSFFPLAVGLKKSNEIITIPVSELIPGDRIIIRNNEVIPVDVRLISDFTHIDYSFVSGESVPVRKMAGELIYAGGRQLEGVVEMEVLKVVSQSYLTTLWNNDLMSKKEQEKEQTLVEKINKYFSTAILFIGVLSFAFWANTDINRGINALTTILIVACPCALLLSATFTNGNILRVLGRNKIYLKNASVIERLAKIDSIVFDKTGTITHGSQVTFKGPKLDDYQIHLAVSLAGQSSHPLSRKIVEQYAISDLLQISDFKEYTGMGIKGTIENHSIIMGSEYFVCGSKLNYYNKSSLVFLSIDAQLIGFFSIASAYREGFEKLASDLNKQYDLKLLTGDNDAERENMKVLFRQESDLFFDQKPKDKLLFIKSLQEQNKKVLMIGDGLNDAGALMQSNVGIAVSDDTNNFSPACDAILDGSAFNKLGTFIAYAKTGKKIIKASFVMSLIYNVIGLFFAIQGTLSPVIAAILMPASSISIVLLTTMASSIAARRKGL